MWDEEDKIGKATGWNKKSWMHNSRMPKTQVHTVAIEKVSYTQSWNNVIAYTKRLVKFVHSKQNKISNTNRNYCKSPRKSKPAVSKGKNKSKSNCKHKSKNYHIKFNCNSNHIHKASILMLLPVLSRKPTVFINHTNIPKPSSSWPLLNLKPPTQKGAKEDGWYCFDVVNDERFVCFKN